LLWFGSLRQEVFENLSRNVSLMLFQSSDHFSHFAFGGRLAYLELNKYCMYILSTKLYISFTGTLYHASGIYVEHHVIENTGKNKSV
jgi:hypothetical protein